MHIVKLQKDKLIIKFHNSPDTLPVHRYAQYQFYYSLAIGISIDNLPNSFASLENYIANNRLPEAKKELYNIKVAFHNALNKMELKSLCIAQLLHSVNDVEVTDFSEGALRNKIQEFSEKGLTKGHVDNIFVELKKKYLPTLID